MVEIPAGEYHVGASLISIMKNCNDGMDNILKMKSGYLNKLVCRPDIFKIDSPEIKVDAECYFIDKYEVTRKQYKECISDGKCEFNGDSTELDSDLPMTNIDWKQANTYCIWRGARLPTEIEWEIAARGKTKTFYPWGDDFSCEKARSMYCHEEIEPGKRVAQKGGSNVFDESEFGVMDMSGNVQEFTSNRYCKRDEKERESGYFCQSYGSYVSIRGSFYNGLPHQSLVRRSIVKIKSNNSFTGFRCARSCDEKDNVKNKN